MYRYQEMFEAIVLYVCLTLLFKANRFETETGRCCRCWCFAALWPPPKRSCNASRAPPEEKSWNNEPTAWLFEQLYLPKTKTVVQTFGFFFCCWRYNQATQVWKTGLCTVEDQPMWGPLFTFKSGQICEDQMFVAPASRHLHFFLLEKPHDQKKWCWTATVEQWWWNRAQQRAAVPSGSNIAGTGYWPCQGGGSPGDFWGEGDISQNQQVGGK